jgi:hypothetical protein
MIKPSEGVGWAGDGRPIATSGREMSRGTSWRGFQSEGLRSTSGKKQMEIDNEQAYKEWTAFFSSAISTAETRIDTYLYLIIQLTGKTPSEIAETQKGLKFMASLIPTLGWMGFLTVSALLAGGYLGFFGSIGALIATNPWLAATLAVIGGGSGAVALLSIWKHRDVAKAAKVVGSNYKAKFENILLSSSDERDRRAQINALHKQCVISIIEQAFKIVLDKHNSSDSLARH